MKVVCSHAKLGIDVMVRIGRMGAKSLQEVAATKPSTRSPTNSSRS